MMKSRRTTMDAWDEPPALPDAVDRYASDPLLAPWTPPPRPAPPPTRLRQGRQRPPRRRGPLVWWRDAPPRARALIAVILVALIFTCSAPGVIAARLALDGVDGARRVSDLQALLAGGVTAALDPSGLARATADLNAAHADFAELDRAANAGQIITDRSPTWSDDARLIRVADLLTGAGQNALDAVSGGLGGLLANPLASGAGPPAITAAQLARVQSDFALAQAQIDPAAALAATIQPDHLRGLPGGAKLGKLLGLLPQIAQTMDQARAISVALPQLLGVPAPSGFLILALDRSELRTGGGFIGNFGTLIMTGGRMGKLGLQDTYPLDAAYYAKTHQQVPAIYPWWPYRYGSPVYGWGLRDSGLAPGFPTDAATAIAIATALGAAPPLSDPYPFAGAIAITVTVMRQIITLAGGSLTLPEYPKHVITAANLEDTIHCFQLGACQKEAPILQPGDAKTTDRKRFTAYLGQALVDQTRQLVAHQMKALLSVFTGDIASKDIQIYFTNPGAEAALARLGAAADVPTVAGDTLFVTDTNIGGNKANAFVSQSEEDIVTLLPDGGALHHLLIRVTYQRQGPLYEGSTGQTAYWEYRRVYYPATARFLGMVGAYGGGARDQTDLTTTSDTANRGMVGAGLIIGDGAALGQCHTGPGDPPGTLWHCAPQTRDTFLFWYTPNAWQRQGGHIVYHDLVQRQAGSTVTLTVRVDATHIANPDAAPLLSSAVRNYDLPSDRAPGGYLAQTGPGWAALEATAPVIFSGDLAHDEVLRWIS